MTEAEFLAALRTLPLHPGANGLSDDSASLGQYVLTTDTIVETIHFLPGDLPGDVAWKLVVTNLSDLAAKGATPVGVLLNYPLSGGAWDTAFLAGFAHVLRSFDTPLLGGDTVSLPHGAPHPDTHRDRECCRRNAAALGREPGRSALRHRHGRQCRRRPCHCAGQAGTRRTA